MKWDVVCRVGEEDGFTVDSTTEPQPLYVGFDRPGAQNRMREHVLDELIRSGGVRPGNHVTDLLHLAMSVYAADMLIPRATAEDRWTRQIELHHPVVEVTRWRGVRTKLQNAISFLTGDEWTFHFRSRADDAVEEETHEAVPWEADRIVLCSGGADSLAGAVSYAEQGERLYLVGHYGGGVTSRFQSAVMDGLQTAYGDRIHSHSFHVVPPSVAGQGENTMRSRSILFIALGLTVADTVAATTPLSIPENGLISLNVPLTTPRIGSASTRTTHPYFIAQVREVLVGLGIQHPLELPYRFKTKGEMFDEANCEVFRSLISQTMSCSHPESARWEGHSPGTHCGYCLPCVIRQAAVRKANLASADTTYLFPVSPNSIDPAGKKGSDLRAIRMALARYSRQPERRDVFRVLDAGPLPPEEVKDYARVYRRGLDEVANLLGVNL